MTPLHKAAQMALDALDAITDDVDGTGLNTMPSFDKALDAIATLREALNAPEPEPVALESVHLTRDTRGMCVVRVNGRIAIRDNGDIIDHMATLEWFAAPPAAPAVPDDEARLNAALMHVLSNKSEPAAPPAAPADDHATPSGGQEAGPQEDRIEAAYWRFDARHKGYSQWKTAPMSERDAFKAEMRNALEAEKVRAEMRLVARGWLRPDTPAAPASQWMPIETAPKDGALFLCWVDAVRCGETDEGQQYEEDVSQLDFCYWRTQSDTPDGGWFDPCCGQIGDRQRVTHWMPLPAAPDHLRDVAEKVAPAAPQAELLTIDQEKALSAEAKTGPFQHTTPVVGNDMQSGETLRLSSKRHAGSTPPAAPAPDGWVPEWAAFLEYWTHESHLQTFADRERFRAAAKAMIAAAPAAPVVREPQPEPVQRLMRFAGKKRSEVSNPCLTAREAIVIADWMQAHGITGASK